MNTQQLWFAVSTREREWIYQLLCWSAILFPFPFQFECNFPFRLLNVIHTYTCTDTQSQSQTQTQAHEHEHEMKNFGLYTPRNRRKNIIWLSRVAVTNTILIYFLLFLAIVLLCNQRAIKSTGKWIHTVFIHTGNADRNERKNYGLRGLRFHSFRFKPAIAIVFFCFCCFGFSFLYFN